MRVAERTIACGLAAALLLALAGAAAAQQAPTPKPAPPRPAPAPAQHPAPPPATQGQATPAAPVDQTPQRTTASYGDWVVRCETTPGPPPQKNCDMEQLAQVQGQAQPISRVAIPLPPKGEGPKMFIQLPINVSFAAPFRRCVPAGCFAEVELKDDLQKKFRAAAAEPGKIVFKDAGDRDVTIPLSFKGFAQAFEALLKQ
jgi:invasion protein IalB